MTFGNVGIDALMEEQYLVEGMRRTIKACLRFGSKYCRVFSLTYLLHDASPLDRLKPRVESYCWRNRFSLGPRRNIHYRSYSTALPTGSEQLTQARSLRGYGNCYVRGWPWVRTRWAKSLGATFHHWRIREDDGLFSIFSRVQHYNPYLIVSTAFLFIIVKNSIPLTLASSPLSKGIASSYKSTSLSSLPSNPFACYQSPFISSMCSLRHG